MVQRDEALVCRNPFQALSQQRQSTVQVALARQQLSSELVQRDEALVCRNPFQALSQQRQSTVQVALARQQLSSELVQRDEALVCRNPFQALSQQRDCRSHRTHSFQVPCHGDVQLGRRGMVLESASSYPLEGHGRRLGFVLQPQVEQPRFHGDTPAGGVPRGCPRQFKIVVLPPFQEKFRKVEPERLRARHLSVHECRQGENADVTLLGRPRERGDPGDLGLEIANEPLCHFAERAEIPDQGEVVASLDKVVLVTRHDSLPREVAGIEAGCATVRVLILILGLRESGKRQLAGKQLDAVATHAVIEQVTIHQDGAHTNEHGVAWRELAEVAFADDLSEHRERPEPGSGLRVEIGDDLGEKVSLQFRDQFRCNVGLNGLPGLEDRPDQRIQGRMMKGGDQVVDGPRIITKPPYDLDPPPGRDSVQVVRVSEGSLEEEGRLFGRHGPQGNAYHTLSVPRHLRSTRHHEQQSPSSRLRERAHDVGQSVVHLTSGGEEPVCLLDDEQDGFSEQLTQVSHPNIGREAREALVPDLGRDVFQHIVQTGRPLLGRLHLGDFQRVVQGKRLKLPRDLGLASPRESGQHRDASVMEPGLETFQRLLLLPRECVHRTTCAITNIVRRVASLGTGSAVSRSTGVAGCVVGAVIPPNSEERLVPGRWRHTERAVEHAGEHRPELGIRLGVVRGAP